MRSFWPSLSPAILARGPSVEAIDLASSGVAPGREDRDDGVALLDQMDCVRGLIAAGRLFLVFGSR